MLAALSGDLAQPLRKGPTHEKWTPFRSLAILHRGGHLLPGRKFIITKRYCMLKLKNFFLVSALIPSLLCLSCSKDPASSDNNNESENQNELETLTDIDGNVYQTVKIGDQVWMAENLKVTRYVNGDSIIHSHAYNCVHTIDIEPISKQEKEELPQLTDFPKGLFQLINTGYNCIPAGCCLQVFFLTHEQKERNRKESPPETDGKE